MSRYSDKLRRTLDSLATGFSQHAEKFERTVYNWNHIKFNVTGVLEFTTQDKAFTPKSLHLPLWALDNKFPWVSVGRAPGIGWMSEVTTTNVNYSTKIHRIEFCPPFPLEWTKLLAYYNYVRNLAKQFSWLDTPGILKVTYSIKFETPHRSFIAGETVEEPW